ncbi:MAG: hypothetical protein B6D62_04890 [Candidatus Cloacimonas sp. 4484_275]|nr:MAG: hypothetical protein B6D62_04890 [Candidatus Cloacimonas sp. 4484_275]
MRRQFSFLGFIINEWLLIASVSGLIITSVYSRRLPSFSANDFNIIFLLFILFVVVKGLDFFLSMFITNDVALIVIVPLTLSLNAGRKDILVILEALAANAGSALTPFGNPQNLFIYWFYHVHPCNFVLEIAPFSLTFLVILIIVSLLISKTAKREPEHKNVKVKFTAAIYGILWLITILIVLRLLPLPLGIIVVIAAIFFDKSSLRIDYALLFTLFCFFGLADNIKNILEITAFRHSEHIFLFSALVSQITSNVPAALLFARFTPHWKVAYKIYVAHKETTRMANFTTKFIIWGYFAFFIGIALYFLVRKIGLIIPQ